MKTLIEHLPLPIGIIGSLAIHAFLILLVTVSETRGQEVSAFQMIDPPEQWVQTPVEQNVRGTQTYYEDTLAAAHVTFAIFPPVAVERSDTWKTEMIETILHEVGDGAILEYDLAEGEKGTIVSGELFSIHKATYVLDDVPHTFHFADHTSEDGTRFVIYVYDSGTINPGEQERALLLILGHTHISRVAQ